MCRRISAVRCIQLCGLRKCTSRFVSAWGNSALKLCAAGCARRCAAGRAADLPFFCTSAPLDRLRMKRLLGCVQRTAGSSPALEVAAQLFAKSCLLGTAWAGAARRLSGFSAGISPYGGHWLIMRTLGHTLRGCCHPAGPLALVEFQNSKKCFKCLSSYV